MHRVCRYFLKMKCFKLFIYTFIICVIFTIFYSLLYAGSSVSRNLPILVWWTQNYPGEKWKTLKCKNNLNCVFTNNRDYRNNSRTKGFLFYGTDFNIFDLPLPRNPEKYIWGLLHEESPRNTPILSHEEALNLFNYSSTVSRHSDVPLTLQHLEKLHEILNDHHFVETKEKNVLLQKISPVLYLQSDCETSSDRDSYVKELMKYIQVDSYGTCLNNKKLPKKFTIDYLNNLDDKDFLNFVARYKFTISFENGICEDYITEKLWRPLKVGSVPVYLGSPNVRDWLPNDRSAILTSDYDSPKHLAAYLEFLNANDEEYDKYLQHKITNKVTNMRLVNELNDRKWGVNNDRTKDSFNDVFECFACKKVHESIQDAKFTPSVVTKKHYDCPKPKTSILDSTLTKSWWIQEWYDNEVKAKKLSKLLLNERKEKLTEKDFYKEPVVVI